MKINVHAGHNPDGMVACGAVGLIKESTEARKVKDKLISILRACGNTVYDCTCDDGSNQSDVLKKIVAKCNSHAADLDLSIHFNSGANDEKGNGKTTGVEVLVYANSGTIAEYAKAVCNSIAALGFKNRGVKVRTDLYVLNSTNAPAMLVECCFVDDEDDVKLYEANKMAATIAEGLGFEEKEVEEMPRYNKIEEVPDWAKGFVQELISEGSIADRNNINLSEDMVREMVIMDRHMKKLIEK